ncbi:putative transposase/invertase (TIGR01784 family) [Scopulibacillus darangshiensis]|uniref:Putative transposase/invertase (TIGR01784 family) n=1 Tax=Scopulibacillus darangshiensis TaxID=442528 RepID=A0A4R2P5M8_9BACL|nr:hypothetical protein [Scopulibacillus darangshiensis]TCP29424.1 putative transposase/invertase (TIGR01784 family) [Scopulibacillus darangshiensis]
MSNASPFMVFEEQAPYLDQDGLWKKILTELFEPFMLFFAPELSENIDWSKRVDSLEQELPGTFPVKKGKKYTDKIMKVHLKNGSEQWILIHIEVQSSKDNDFSERMYMYFSRIFNAYHRKIYAIAVFADDRKSFKPNTFTYNFYGTRLTYTYNTYKLLDQDENTLLLSENPFSLAVLAGIYMIKGKNNAVQRYQFKRRLLQLLLQGKENDYKRKEINALFYFIDFLLEIPLEMTSDLLRDITPLIDKEAILMNQAMNSEPSPTLKEFLDMKRVEWKREGNLEGKIEGKIEGKKEMARAMFKEDIPFALILRITGLSKEELENIVK